MERTLVDIPRYSFYESTPFIFDREIKRQSGKYHGSYLQATTAIMCRCYF